MGRKFIKPMNGNMQLTRSKDKKILSLTNFDRTNKYGDYFQVQAWTLRLKKFQIFQKLIFGMNSYYHTVKDNFDELIEVSFCGNNQYVQLIYVQKKERSLQEQQDYEREILAAAASTSNCHAKPTSPTNEQL